MEFEELPEMTNPLGKHWKQPCPDNIEIDETHALMSKLDFDKLADYSSSRPSGVYIGKMWKSIDNKGVWWLMWFDESELGDAYCYTCSREIISL